MAAVETEHRELGLSHTAYHLDPTVPDGQDYEEDPARAALEFVIALILSVLLLPVMAFVALLIKLTSRGPVLYTQVRLGRQGRLYRIIKFRTMRHNCEKQSGPRWSTPGDPRITPLGRFLRKSHLDELPQLWNVLRGEMNLVGPRPERPEFVGPLGRAIPRYYQRLQVRPGVTGLAQVHLPPDTDLESVRRKLAYDLYYVRHRSLWLDVRIIFSTALNLIGLPFGLLLPRLLLVPVRAEEEGSSSSRMGVIVTERGGVTA